MTADPPNHYNDVIMSTMASQITSLTIVYSSVYTGAVPRKQHSSMSLAFVWGIHRWPVNSPHKGTVTPKMFPFDDVIMSLRRQDNSRRGVEYHIQDKRVIVFQGNRFKRKMLSLHGPLTRYVKLRVGHAPVLPGTTSPPLWVSDPDMHHGTCVTRVPWCMSGLLTSGFLWNRWKGKLSWHSWIMSNPQFYVSGKTPMENLFKLKSYFPGQVTSAVIFFALFGKFCITVSFAVMVLYTREIFPTNLR